MQEKQSIRELGDEELEGVVGGSGLAALTSTGPSSMGTSIETTAFVVGGRVNRVFATTASNTILTAEGPGISWSMGFAVVLGL